MFISTRFEQVCQLLLSLIGGRNRKRWGRGEKAVRKTLRPTEEKKNTIK